ncbi:MAG: hypothetical protein SOX50_15595 [Terrisporobacter othiniensis]|uniref:hypothetical protein n=1 Tax=Terrisporobacter othiniensis TaxID=1577792 RepID=UPI002A76543A|nr:hypothetical protein [Terrisporobacter othiniensis]MDY3374688.1 hypothetical protein [Terrisporobacter othiniensis]
MIVIFRVALLLTVMAFSYHLYKFLYRKNVIEKMVNDFETNYQKRQELEEKVRREEGNVIKKGFIHHIDIMIERSRLRKKIPFLTTELYLVISIIVGLACFILSKLFIQFWVVNVLVGILSVFGMYLVIYYSSGFNFEKIDDQIITLINDIENFSNVSNDIVTIFENVADYLDDPLDEYFMEFVQYSRETGDIEGAFKNIEGKLENEKLQNLFKNLEIASRNRANYKELMKEARSIFSGYFDSKTKRKILISNGRAGIFTLLIVGIGMLYFVGLFIEGFTAYIINTFFGNVLMFLGIILFLYALWNFINIDR